MNRQVFREGDKYIKYIGRAAGQVKILRDTVTRAAGQVKILNIEIWPGSQ